MRPRCESGCAVTTNPVGGERKHTGEGEPPRSLLADRLPNQPASADLGERGEHEQQRTAGDRHARHA